MTRPDISNKLVHFTGPRQDMDEAYGRLRSILSDRCIIAGEEKIKGRYQCVCFTESPLISLSSGLVNVHNYSQYAPFGIMFDKRWIFQQGGRPVIYQTDTEYDELPQKLRWRHVRYEPTNEPPIDFTWEREWRINCEELVFSPVEVVILVPDEEWRERLLNDHEDDKNYVVRSISLVLDDDIAQQYWDNFPWQVMCLDSKSL